MKHVVIHVGPPKTGTSAIQYWCNQHRAELSKHGVMYPGHVTDTNNISSGNLKAIFSRNATGEWRPDEEKIDILLARFKQSNAHTLLLSSEFFFPEIIALNQLIPDVEFIVYLRNPIEVLESNYNQEVKRHRQTSPFKVPINIKYSILLDLAILLEHESKPRIIIRPYAHPLFVNGSIISDILDVVGVDRVINSPPTINPSYTFEALEFKRHANHFPLGKIDYSLDLILQRLSFGTSSYSLLPTDRYLEIKANILVQLREFIDLHHIDHLEPFYEFITNADQKASREQYLDTESLNKIANNIRLQSPAVYRSLARLARNNKNIVLPNNDYFRCFETEPDESEFDIELANIQALFSLLRSETVKHEADMCREIALYLDREGQQGSARFFMEAANQLKPQDEFIRLKINQYRISSNSPPSHSGGIKNQLQGILSSLLKKWRE